MSSNQQQQQQAQLPSVEQAMQVTQDLGFRTFFGKLASLGYELYGNEQQRTKQAEALLSVAEMIAMAEQHPATQKAAEDNDFYINAAHAMRNELEKAGYWQQQPQLSVTPMDVAQEHSRQLLQVPQIYDSMLSVKLAQLEQQNQYQQGQGAN